MSSIKIALIFCGFIATCWTAYLPTNDQRQAVNQLQQQNAEQQQPEQQQQQHKLLHEWLVAEQRHHQSYDKNDDVVVNTLKDEESNDLMLHMQKSDDHGDDEDNKHNDDDDDDDHVVVANGENDEDSDGVNDNDEDSDDDRLVETPQHKRRERRELSDWLIAPNTRWCGRGNTANGTYNHLGGASSADKCCRKHDHCQMYIPGMSNRYELFNYRPYTLSHCNCDRRFRTCLKMANDDDANTIGKLFFNMVQTQCFVVKNERVCQQRAVDGSCERETVKQKAYLRNNKKF